MARGEYSRPYSAGSVRDSGSSKRKKYTFMYSEVLVHVHPPVQCLINTLYLSGSSKKKSYFQGGYKIYGEDT